MPLCSSAGSTMSSRSRSRVEVEASVETIGPVLGLDNPLKFGEQHLALGIRK
jgi:hypothetical protein